MQLSTAIQILKTEDYKNIKLDSTKWLAKFMRDFNITEIPKVVSGTVDDTEPFGYLVDAGNYEDETLLSINFGLVAWIAHYFNITLEEVEEVWREENTSKVKEKESTSTEQLSM